MNKMNRYNNPLVKRQQRKQKRSGAYFDELQNRCDKLLEELKSERNENAPKSQPTRT